MHDKKRGCHPFLRAKLNFLNAIYIEKTLHIVPKLYVVDNGFLNLYTLELSQSPPEDKRG
jgi:hypothetical protein